MAVSNASTSTTTNAGEWELVISLPDSFSPLNEDMKSDKNW